MEASRDLFEDLPEALEPLSVAWLDDSVSEGAAHDAGGLDPETYWICVGFEDW